MIEIWRKDAVYTFDFWPGAEVKPLREIKFRVAGSEVNVSYKWPTDHGYASAREAVAAVEERCLRINSERIPVVSSGVRSFDGVFGEAWRCELDLLDGELAAEVIAREYDDGLVLTFERKPEDRAGVLATAGKLAVLASRTERVDRGGVAPAEGELSYLLGPVQILAPELWGLNPEVTATLIGDRRFEFHELGFEFAEGTNPEADWFETPPYVKAHLIEDDMLVRTNPAETSFPAGTSTSICWGAVPTLDDPEPPYAVETTVVTLIRWSNGGACRIMATQWIPYAEFDREGDLVGLRDLTLRIAASGRRELRLAA